MKLLFSLLSSFLLINLTLSAESVENLAPTTLATTEGLIDSLVAGCVSPITGNFVESEVDIVVPGQCPLVLSRSYNSDDTIVLGYLGTSWRFSDLTLLVVDENFEHNNVYALVTTHHGASAKYKKKIKGKKGEFEFSFVKSKGYTNCGSGILSGQTHLKNNRLILNNHDKEHKFSGVFTSSDQSVRSYRYQFEDPAQNRLYFGIFSEIKPNGSRIDFSYSKKSILEKISCQNWKQDIEYGSISFKFPKELKKNPSFVVSTSNNKTITYHYRKNKYKDDFDRAIEHTDYYLEKVERPHKPNDSYKYVKATRGKGQHRLILSEKVRPNGRVLQIEYYEEGTNLVGDQKIKLKKTDIGIDQVKCLKAPVGTDRTLYNTHLFFYYQKYDKKNEYQGGYTEVFDAGRNKTAYHYTKEDRLTNIIKYQGSQKDSEETFFWGEEDHHDEGNLLAKYTQDASGSIHKGIVFYYDDRGNVTESREYGAITGLLAAPITLDSATHRPRENGAEYYKHSYSYDSSNRLIHEREQNGKGIAYSYYPNTNAITSKLVFDGSDRIFLREFNEFDENLFLRRKISDDGQGRESLDLSGVTCRKITCYTPTKEFPFGLIASQEEKYLDLQTGQELSLHKTLNHYSTDGHLLQQEHYDSEGKYCYTLQWEYDAHGNVTKEVNALGYTTTCEYDENDNKTKEQGPDLSYYTSYTYDFSNRLIKEEQIHDNGLREVLSHKYDLIGNRIASIDRFGNETQFLYDSLNRLTQTIYPDGAIEKTTYDCQNRPISYTDPRGLTTLKTYNLHGKPTHIEYPNGTVETFEYNFDGSLAKSCAPNGTATYTAIDYLGRIIKKTIIDRAGNQLSVESWEYSSFNLLSHIDPEGLVTNYTYDSAGRISGMIKEDQHTTYEYDSLGRQYKIIEWLDSENAKVTIQVFDFLNRVIQKRIEDLQGHVFSQYEFAYDEMGNQTLSKNGDNVLYTCFNHRGEPTSITDALGNQTVFEYDNTIHKVCQTDPMGNQTITLFDVRGRESQIFQQNSFGLLTSDKKIHYDASGNESTVSYDVITNHQVLRTFDIQMEYDKGNQILSCIEAAGTPEQKITRYRYNSFGEKEALIKPDGSEIHYTYNPHGCVKTIQARELFYQYTYNKNHLVLSVTESDEKTTLREYDLLGRMTFETLANGLGIAYTYDTLNRLKTITLPDESVISYTYTPTDLKTVSKGPYVHTYETRNIAGKPISTQLIGLSGNIKNVYDQLNRLIASKHSSWQQDLIYDEVGNITQKNTVDAIGQTLCSYTYDDLYQITSENGFANHTYASDSLNNRLKYDTENWSINNLNQLTSTPQGAFTYDLNGNLLSTPDGTTYTYDAFDRLIAITKEGQTFTYTYDPFHRRLSKGSDLFLYQGQSEIGRYVNGVPIELRILGEGKGAEIGATIAIELKNVPYAPLHDHNGNIICLLSLSGVIAETYRYSAFGEEITPETLGNPWRFSSKRMDPETGFIYFGQRYYAPQLGRWITPDPIGFEDGPNLYAYLHNNPLICFDEEGLWTNSDDSELPWIEGIGTELREFASNTISMTASMGEWLKADLDYEYGNNRRSLDLKMHSAYSCCNQFGNKWVANPIGTTAEVLFPGCYRACNLSSKSSSYDASCAITAATIDVGLLLLPALKGMKSLNRISKLDEVATLGESLGARVMADTIDKSYPIWSSTKDKTSVQNAFKHWKDHRAEFPELHNAKQYVECAFDLFNRQTEGRLIKYRANGEILLYQTGTNTFGAFTKTGIPKTMFRPKLGLKYFQKGN